MIFFVFLHENIYVVGTLYFFLFLHENICCGYSLEVPQCGASNEYPQYMLLWRNKKSMNIFWLIKKCLIWSDWLQSPVTKYFLIFLFDNPLK